MLAMPFLDLSGQAKPKGMLFSVACKPAGQYSLQGRSTDNSIHACMLQELACRACWRLEAGQLTEHINHAGVGSEACAPTVRCSRSCFGPLNMKKNVRDAFIIAYLHTLADCVVATGKFSSLVVNILQLKKEGFQTPTLRR